MIDKRQKVLTFRDNCSKIEKRLVRRLLHRKLIMFTLSEETKKRISANVCASQDAKPQFSHTKITPLIFGRGNPYLAKRKFTTMEELDSQMTKRIEKTQNDAKSNSRNK